MARNSLNVLRSKIPRMRARPRRFVAEIRIGVPVGTLIKHRGGGIATAPQIRDSRLKMTERKRERERERERERDRERKMHLQSDVTIELVWRDIHCRGSSFNQLSDFNRFYRHNSALSIYRSLSS